MVYIFTIIVSYLVGSIPFGYLAGRFAGIDIRQCGSGNIGATNVLRVLGKKSGYVVFFADALKGLLAVRLAFWIGNNDPIRSQLLGILAAISVVVGHSFPVWLRFRGGKGVASSAGACFGLMPVPTLFGSVVWVLVFFTFRYVSLASIVAAMALPLTAWALSLRENSPDYALVSFASVTAALVIWRHRDNIIRLTNGTEPRFKRR
jgi:glycerol-3-phosphate acyltransferase PlsY